MHVKVLRKCYKINIDLKKSGFFEKMKKKWLKLYGN